MALTSIRSQGENSLSFKTWFCAISNLDFSSAKSQRPSFVQCSQFRPQLNLNGRENLVFSSAKSQRPSFKLWFCAMFTVSTSIKSQRERDDRWKALRLCSAFRHNEKRERGGQTSAFQCNRTIMQLQCNALYCALQWALQNTEHWNSLEFTGHYGHYNPLEFTGHFNPLGTAMHWNSLESTGHYEYYNPLEFTRHFNPLGAAMHWNLLGLGTASSVLDNDIQVHF